MTGQNQKGGKDVERRREDVYALEIAPTSPEAPDRPAEAFHLSAIPMLE
jgi:hypothetical protein